MFAPRSFFAVLAVALLAMPAAAPAQQEATEENPVIARLNGEEIRQSEVMEMVAGLPTEYQAQFAQLYPLFVQRLIDFKLAGRAGPAGTPDCPTTRRSRRAWPRSRGGSSGTSTWNARSTPA